MNAIDLCLMVTGAWMIMTSQRRRSPYSSGASWFTTGTVMMGMGLIFAVLRSQESTKLSETQPAETVAAPTSKLPITSSSSSPFSNGEEMEVIEKSNLEIDPGVYRLLVKRPRDGQTFWALDNGNNIQTGERVVLNEYHWESNKEKYLRVSILFADRVSSAVPRSQPIPESQPASRPKSPDQKEKKKSSDKSDNQAPPPGRSFLFLVS